MPGTYPDYTPNIQNTKYDIPGRTDIANAQDYNDHDLEIIAHQDKLKNHEGRIVVLEGLDTLAELTDVSIPSPTGWQVLSYNAATSKWFNRSISEGASETDPFSWHLSDNQGGITGAKQGSFNLTTTGNITATYFYGDGSNLTGLTSSFLGLTDTPNSYASMAGSGVRVNATQTGLEFFDPGFTDIDTLQVVTDRGNTTTQNITAAGITLKNWNVSAAQHLILNAAAGWYVYLAINDAMKVIMGTTTLSSNDDGVMSLGTASKRWNNLYISGNSYLGASGIFENISTKSITASGNLVLDGDLLADRWLHSETNTFLGMYVAGAATISHAGGYDGWYNVGIGYNALHDITTGYRNIAIGDEALHKVTIGTGNVAIGSHTLEVNTDGSNNVAIGNYCMYSNTDGSLNVALGQLALSNNTTGAGNFALGENALALNVDGDASVAIGNAALRRSLGDYNTAIGQNASTENTTGTNNVSAGKWSNYYNQTGSNNTIIGTQAGMGTTWHNKSGCVFLGSNAGYSEHNSNKLYIENSNSSSPLIYGDFQYDYITLNGELRCVSNLLVAASGIMQNISTKSIIASGNIDIAGTNVRLDVEQGELKTNAEYITFDKDLEGVYIQTTRGPQGSSGASLNIKVGGAGAGSTNTAGAPIAFKSGKSTGNQASEMYFYTAPAGPAGTQDNDTTLKLTISGDYIRSEVDLDLVNNDLTTTGDVTATTFYGDGSNLTGISGGGGGTPSGVFTSIQFNDSGYFGGNAGLTYDKSTFKLTASGILQTNYQGWNALSIPTDDYDVRPGVFLGGQKQGMGTSPGAVLWSNGTYLTGHIRLWPSSYYTYNYGYFLPEEDNEYDLGDPTLRWSNLFLGGDAYVDASGIFQNISAQSITASGNISLDILAPGTSRVYTDASGALCFNDTITGLKHLYDFGTGTGGGGVTSHPNLTNLNWAAAGHTLDSSLIPTSSGAYDIGSAAVAFDDAYIDKVHSKTSIDTAGDVSAAGSFVGSGFIRDFTFALALGTPAASGTNLTNALISPRPGVIKKAFAYAKTAPSGAALIFDINQNGSTIWSAQANRLTIAAGANLGAQSSFNTTALAEADILTIDVDQVGSTVAGQDVTVVLHCQLRNS